MKNQSKGANGNMVVKYGESEIGMQCGEIMKMKHPASEEKRQHGDNGS
jgi:hypothetical protein